MEQIIEWVEKSWLKIDSSLIIKSFEITGLINGLAETEKQTLTEKALKVRENLLEEHLSIKDDEENDDINQILEDKENGHPDKFASELKNMITH